MRRTKEEFVAIHKHHFAGLVLDAATGKRAGAELSLWLGTVMRGIEDRLERAYDDLKPKEPVK